MWRARRAWIEHVACLGDDHPGGVGEADDSTGHVARRRGGGEHGGDRNRGDDHSGGLHACLARLDDQDASILDIRNRARPGRDDGRRQGLDVDGHTRGSLRAATGEEGGADDHAIRAVDGKREPVLRLASICRGRVTGCRGGDRRVRQQLLGGGPHLGELALDLGGGNLGLIGQALVMGDPRLFRDQANERRDGGDRQDRDGDEAIDAVLRRVASAQTGGLKVVASPAAASRLGTFQVASGETAAIGRTATAISVSPSRSLTSRRLSRPSRIGSREVSFAWESGCKATSGGGALQ